MIKFDRQRRMSFEEAEFWRGLFILVVDCRVPLTIATARSNEGFVPMVNRGILLNDAVVEARPDGSFKVELYPEDSCAADWCGDTLVGDTFFLNKPELNLVSVSAEGRRIVTFTPEFNGDATQAAARWAWRYADQRHGRSK